MPETAIATRLTRRLDLHLSTEAWAHVEKYAGEIGVPVEAVVSTFVELYAERREAEIKESRERKLEIANSCHHP